ncbi:hypothetical protein KLP28_02510 [Nocardioidaceae bacterium]|nr:hypothetical protein KLP28_02510 [Nocardioidaceae bacterium]
MSVHIDCDSCVVRGLACSDCVVSVLLGMPDAAGAGGTGGTGPDVIADDELRALDVLADSGLVPPLRMVAAQDPPQGLRVESA